MNSFTVTTIGFPSPSFAKAVGSAKLVSQTYLKSQYPLLYQKILWLPNKARLYTVISIVTIHQDTKVSVLGPRNLIMGRCGLAKTRHR